MNKAILITGGTGYLGKRLARHLLEATDRPVVLWVRAKDEALLAARRAALEAELGATAPRLTVAGGELSQEAPFASVDGGSLAWIVHAAADIRFNVDEETAQRVNIEGAEKLFRFAATCPRLESLCYLSTAYACGLATGVVEEARLSSEKGFANHYERSKWTGEEALFTRHDALPWRICRVATIVADDESGAVSQYNAVHNTFKLLFYGLVSLVPGDADCPMYFITGDFAARAVHAILERGERRAVYHVSHTGDEAITLGGLLDLMYARFMRDAEFKAKRILPPVMVDQASFDELTGVAKSLSGEVVNQAVTSMAPFSRQLFVPKRFRNDRMAAIFDGVRGYDAKGLMERTADYLVKTRWGRKPLAAAAAPASAGGKA